MQTFYEIRIEFSNDHLKRAQSETFLQGDEVDALRHAFNRAEMRGFILEPITSATVFKQGHPVAPIKGEKLSFQDIKNYIIRCYDK